MQLVLLIRQIYNKLYHLTISIIIKAFFVTNMLSIKHVLRNRKTQNKTKGIEAFSSLVSHQKFAANKRSEALSLICSLALLKLAHGETLQRIHQRLPQALLPRIPVESFAAKPHSLGSDAVLEFSSISLQPLRESLAASGSRIPESLL